MGKLTNPSLKNTLERAALLVLSLLLFLALPPHCAAFADDVADTPENRFELDADSIIYDSEAGVATANGSVKLRGNDMQMFAPRAVYDVKAGVVSAHSEGDDKIVLIAGEATLTGQSVEYDVNSSQGILTQPSGKMDAIFFQGGDVVVMPAAEAVSRKLISKARAGLDGSRLTGFWDDVSATTCDFPEPHYKLVTKKAMVVLNKRVILKNPQLYLEKRMIFHYPFDYVIPLDKSERQNLIVPKISYHSDKGVGLGLAGPILWDSGQIDVSVAYWTDGITEAEFAINQHIGRDLTLFAESNRLYNKDDKETLWRQRWGIKYHNPSGWTASLLESQRELVETEMRPGMDRRYNVWRSPEFSFSSPWFNLAPEHFFRFGGMWGRYQDNLATAQPTVGRIMGEARIFGEPLIKNWSVYPFYNAGYRYFHYRGEDTSQRVTDLILGFRWNLGRIKLGTAYVRRWASGDSPLFWDRYLDREDLYQQVAFEFPGKREWETWELGVRAGYDFVDSKLNEMVYSISYNKHCLTWQLYARESKPKDEFSIGLRFIINAYPDTALSLGETDIYDPFERPVPRTEQKK